MAELGEKLQIAQAEAAMHASNHATEQQQRGQLEAQMTELGEKLQIAQAEAALTIANLHQRLATEADRFSDLSERHMALERDHDTLRETSAELAQERDHLRSALDQNRAETHDLYEKASADTRQIVDLETGLRDLSSKYTTLERKAERMARHLDAMTQKLMGRIAQNIDWRLKVGADGAQAITPPKIDTLEQKIMVLTREADAHMVNLAAEKQARSVIEARITELEQALHSTHLYAQSLQAQQSSDAQARAAAQTRIAELEQTLQNTQRHVQSLEDQRSHDEQTRIEAEARIGELNHALQAARQDLEALHAQQAETQQARQHAEAYAEALLSSTSWRITAPLRSVVHKIRRQE